MAEQFADEDIYTFMDATPIERASQDPDLVAIIELRALGFTDAVSPERADILEDYDTDVMREELAESYNLDHAGVCGAIARAMYTVNQRNRKLK